MKHDETPANDGGDGRGAAPARDDYRLTGGETIGARNGAANPLLEIAMILGRANIHCLAGGLRLGARATRRLLQGQLRVLNHVTSAERDRAHVLRVVADEARGCLREVADISSEELQHLKTTLGTLQGETRAIISHEDDATRDRRHVRYGRAKD
jgi:hypothetical protein